MVSLSLFMHFPNFKASTTLFELLDHKIFDNFGLVTEEIHNVEPTASAWS